MFCSKCGKEIDEKSKFCKYCGAEIIRNKTTDIVKKSAADAAKKSRVSAAGKTPAGPGAGKESPHITPKNLKMILAVCGSLLLIIILLIALPKGRKNADSKEKTDGQYTETADGIADEETGVSSLSGGSSTEGSPERSDLSGGDGQKPLDNAGDDITEPFRIPEPDSSESEEFQKAYLTTWNSMDKIIAEYWEDGDELDRAINGLLGSTEMFYQEINRLDPELLDSASAAVAEKGANNSLEYHLIREGMNNTIFADNELGRQLRDVGERAFLGMLEMLIRYGEGQNSQSDLLVAEVVSGDYALMHTKGNVGAILYKMDIDTGYNLVGPAVDDYREKLVPIASQLFEEGRIAYNTQDAEKEAEVNRRSDTVRGIQAALDAYEEEWNNERKEWTDSFFNAFGITSDQAAQEDYGRYVYCVIDKYGTIYCSMLLNAEAGYWINDEGTFSYNTLVHDEDDPGKTRRIVTVCDRNGNLLYRDEGLQRISPCGNILKITNDNSFEYGDFSILELVYPDGSSKEVLRARNIDVTNYSLPSVPLENEGWVRTICGYNGDTLLLFYDDLETNRDREAVIDMVSGKITDRGEWDADHPDPINIMWSNKNNVDIRIDFRYKVIRATGEVSLRSDPGNVVATIETGGGIEQVFHDEENGLFWVYTRNKYYYVTDENFNRLYEPVRIERPSEFSMFTPYGVLLLGDGETILQDAQGNEICRYDHWMNDVWSFILGKAGKTWGEYDSTKSDHDMSYNLYTKERMYWTIN